MLGIKLRASGLEIDSQPRIFIICVILWREIY
jgi:hypothetical protein